MELKDMIEKMNNEKLKAAKKIKEDKKTSEVLTNALQEARKRKQEMFKK